MDASSCAFLDCWILYSLFFVTATCCRDLYSASRALMRSLSGPRVLSHLLTAMDVQKASMSAGVGEDASSRTHLEEAMMSGQLMVLSVNTFLNKWGLC